MKYILYSSILILVLFSACKTKKLTLANPQASIESAIVDCINLLEKERYTELLSKYIYPDAKEEILKNQTMEDLAKGFKGKKAERLLAALKIAQTKEIEYKKEGILAIIKMDENFKGPKKLEFMKKGKLWYIAD